LRAVSAELRVGVADGVLLLHLGVILFNIFGLVAPPLGAWLGWRFVRIFWWRALHLASLAAVALQALLGRACFLTVWQDDLLAGAGGAVAPEPLIRHWVDRLVYWPLPLWVFAVAYVAVWVYALALWRLVPPRRRSSPAAASGAKPTRAPPSSASPRR
jgi:hypothetical protein